MAKSHKYDEVFRPSPQRPQYPNLYVHIKRWLGSSCSANLYKRSVVRQGKKATHKCSGVEGGFSGPSEIQGPVSKPDRVGCFGQLNSSSLHKQTRRNTLYGDGYSLLENHDLVPSLQHNPKSQTHSRVPEHDGRCSAKVNSSPINKMDSTSTSAQTYLLTTCLNHKVPFYVSPVPAQIAWDIDPLNINWLGLCLCLPSHGSPLQVDPKNQAIQLPHHCNCPRLAWDALVLGPSAALHGDPTVVISINETSQKVPHPSFLQQTSVSQPFWC